MDNNTVEISVGLAPVVTSITADDAFVDLKNLDKAGANASLIVDMLKAHGSRVTALRDWDLLDDQEFTINVTHKSATGVVTRASW